jgi:hypothetical protein
LHPFLDFILFIQCCHYYSFDCAVTWSTRRSSTPDTDHGLIISTFTSLRLPCPLRDLPCTIAGPASSHHTYHLVSPHHHRCDITHPTMPPTPPQTYLPGRLSPLSYFQISCSYILSFITSFINCHLVRGIVARSCYDNGMIVSGSVVLPSFRILVTIITRLSARQILSASLNKISILDIDR